MTKEQILQLAAHKYHIDERCIFAANVFFRINNKDMLMTGYVINNQYFINETTGKLYNCSDFYMINNLDDFKD